MRASLGHTMQYILQASQDTACVHHLATQCSTYCRQARTQHACITWPHNAVHIAGKPGHSMRASLGHTMQYILQASQDTACVHHLATQCSTYCRQARTQHACITWPHNAVHIAGKPGHSMRASLGHNAVHIAGKPGHSMRASLGHNAVHIAGKPGHSNTICQ